MNTFPEPLGSLDPVTWLVYADWCAENGQDEDFPRAVGKVLPEAIPLLLVGRWELELPKVALYRESPTWHCWKQLEWLTEVEWRSQIHPERLRDWNVQRSHFVGAAPPDFPGLLALRPTLARSFFAKQIQERNRHATQRQRTAQTQAGL